MGAHADRMAATWIAVVLASTLAGGSVPAAERRVALEYKRDRKASSRPADVPAPSVPDVPDDLRVAAPAVPAPQVGGESPARLARPGGTGDVDAAAERAADAMVLEAVGVWGFTEYWRAGFARGTHTALNDPRVGAWDRVEGLRFGRLDPAVRPLGQQVAAEAAAETAARAAGDRVRDQFLELDRVPVRDVTTRSQRAGVPAFAGPFAVAPDRDAVFAAYPIATAPRLSQEGRKARGGWAATPSQLVRDERHGVYDERWKDAVRAFTVWRERQRPGSTWSRLGSAQRQRFRDVFLARFDQRLSTTDLRRAYAGWRIGWEDGWRYGALLQAEWAYREGYAEGFDLGVREVAAIAYPYAWERAYSQAYAAHFDDWSRSARPGIVEARVEDEDDDGIFEPGERAVVSLALVNYGGGAGTFDASARGELLEGESAARVTLPARARAARPTRLTPRIDPRAAIRARGTIAVTVGDARAEIPLTVSHPLAIEGPPAVEADRLEGRVRLNVSVVNSSRRSVRATASAERVEGGVERATEDLGAIEAGGRRSVDFGFVGIHPLDLIAGEAHFRITVIRAGTANDQREIGVEPVVTDFGNPDLVTFMVDLARSPRVSPPDVAEVRSLLFERLRADWDRARFGPGNPYKRDLESGSAETALGELVRAVRSEHGRLASPQVFQRLGGDIAGLADDLPGAHPLLRKWMKRLAKTLP